MEGQGISITKIKQNLLKIPTTKLSEVGDFIESILKKTESDRLKRVESLEGIWKGLGFERIIDLESSLRGIRSESEKNMLDRTQKCNS